MSSEDMDRFEVYLRVKPVLSQENDVVEIKDDRTVIIDPQLSGQRQLLTAKAVRYTFEHIFAPTCEQETIFQKVALPSVHDVLSGKPALVFMYGVTGSGKTYTMTGTSEKAGILPRTLDVLFNSIPTNLRAMKYLFKPDNFNSYDIQRTEDAMTDRQNAYLGKCKGTPAAEKTPGKKKYRMEQNAWKRDRKERDQSKVSADIPEYCKVAVFVQYVEIYNNSVYDLLEEEASTVHGRARGPQSKMIREDVTKGTFVFGATEIEVENADEAMEVWLRGQSRKRVAHTQMNSESSRSHSVFMIKVVQAPVSEKTGEVVQKKDFMTVTQFNLVDLAGCERAHKTAATGERLKEASSINNSLMSLRLCLDALRENQITGSNKMVPYRESKLTHLFRSFFEGRGKVKMLVCVNPRGEDCAETIEVMKFSESAQEIEMHRVQPNRVQQYIEPSPAQSIEDLRMTTPEPVIVPACLSAHMHTESDIMAIQKLCKDGAKEVSVYRVLFEEKGMQIREGVRSLSEELQNLKNKVSSREREYRQKSKALQDALSKLNQDIRERDHLKEKLIEVEAKKESSEKRALHFEEQLRKAKDNQVRIRKDAEIKWTKEREILISKMDKVLNEQKSEAMKKGAAIAKANLLKDIIGVNELKNIDTPTTTHSRSSRKPQTLKERTKTFHTIETRSAASTSVKPAVPSSSEPDLSDIDSIKTKKISQHAMKTRRRSKSNDGRWLEHTDGENHADDVMQPYMTRKKSVSKLETKDLETVDKYALVTNKGNDIQVVKGDVLVSPTGGTAVVFTGVETLTRSKAGSTKRKESDDEKEHVGPMDTKKRCGVAIEGHPYMKNVIRRGKDEKFV